MPKKDKVLKQLNQRGIKNISEFYFSVRLRYMNMRSGEEKAHFHTWALLS
jgi:hypothetical protein